MTKVVIYDIKKISAVLLIGTWNYSFFKFSWVFFKSRHGFYDFFFTVKKFLCLTQITASQLGGIEDYKKPKNRSKKHLKVKTPCAFRLKPKTEYKTKDLHTPISKTLLVLNRSDALVTF